mmetsp:Transcript_743/g.2210  ORF Transcript_743/g.2210 Transcript_743/m.2210 type:complete len:654 (+) Transcript_743:52-2013(+)
MDAGPRKTQEGESADAAHIVLVIQTNRRGSGARGLEAALAPEEPALMDQTPRASGGGGSSFPCCYCSGRPPRALSRRPLPLRGGGGEPGGRGAAKVGIAHLEELVVVDGLLLDQPLRHRVQQRLVLGERAHAGLKRARHNLLHLLVDLRLHVGRRNLGLHQPVALGRLPRDWAAAELVKGEAPLRNHPPRDAAHLLQVARRTRRHHVLPVDDLLDDAPRERDGELTLEVALRVEARGHLLLGGREEGEAARAVRARQDGHLGHLVVVRREGAHDGVARLVVGNEPLPLREGGAGLLDHADSDAVDGVVDLVVPDHRLVVARRHDRRLVEQVGQRGAREARRPLGDHHHVEVVGEGLAARVDLEDLEPPVHVGKVDGHAPVEAARPQQRRVEHVRAVGRREDNDAAVSVEAVHLGEDLVEGLLALVAAAAAALVPAGALPADRVNLVDEDDARRVLLCLAEQVTHARRPDADEHLDELGSRGGNEGDARLPRDGAREQRLARAGRSGEQDALGQLASEPREALRVSQVLDDVLQVGDRLLGAAHVAEPLRRAVHRLHLRREAEPARQPARLLAQQRVRGKHEHARQRERAKELPKLRARRLVPLDMQRRLGRPARRTRPQPAAAATSHPARRVARRLVARQRTARVKRRDELRQ